MSQEEDEMADSARVLIVANRTAATPTLIYRVRARAQQGPSRFTLLVPALPDVLEPGEEARKTLELALPLLEEAAKGPVEGAVGPSDALRAIEQVLAREHVDEIIISTLPERVSAWLRRDLPSRVERLGVPVTVVRAKERPHAAVWSGSP
jgi:hypothetical protein